MNDILQKLNDMDDAEDLVLLAQAESLLPSLEKAAEIIGIYKIADKTEFMCFKQDGVICTLNRKSLKLEVRFIYFGIC